MSNVRIIVRRRLHDGGIDVIVTFVTDDVNSINTRSMKLVGTLGLGCVVSD